MQIVPFTPQDQEQTEDFMTTIFKEMGWTPKPEEKLDNLAEFFHLPEDGLLLLAKENNQIIGTVGVVKIDNATGLIKRMYVAKEFINGGIGKKLLARLITDSKRLSISRIILSVVKTSLPAINLYEKSGFRRYEQKKVEGWPESFLQNTHYYYGLDI